MNYVEHRFALDVHETVSRESVCVKKGNTAHRLLIHLMEKGRPFHISPECYAVFTAKKPDGKVVFNDCTIEDCVIIYDFTPQTVAAAGLLESEIMLYGADDTLLTSSSFRIVVEDTVYDEEKELDSQTEATALTKLISEATTLITDVEGKLENGEFVGPQYVLTNADKAEIAEMAAELVDVPGSGGNVDQEQISAAVNEALAEAKASGEFDGEDGKDGYTPVKGIDYFDGQPGKDGADGKDGYTPVKGVDYFDGIPGKDGIDGKDGSDGYTPVKGKDYFDGNNGQDGTSVTVTKVTESTEDGGSNVVVFSDGKTMTVKNGKTGTSGKDGSNGKTPVKGTDYWTSADKAEMVNAVIAALPVYNGEVV